MDSLLEELIATLDAVARRLVRIASSLLPIGLFSIAMVLILNGGSTEAKAEPTIFGIHVTTFEIIVLVGAAAVFPIINSA